MSPGDRDARESHSVTRFIAALREQDPEAAQQIWRRFFERLLPQARARLGALRDRAADEEDVLVSVFDGFFKAVRENRFAALNDRNDLWQILLMLTDRKIAEQYRRSHAQKRGAGRTQRLEDLTPACHELRELADKGPGPEFVAAFNDQLARAVERLDEPATREVALLRLEGFENAEIAARLGVSLSTVERKLRVVRTLWETDFADNA